MCDLKAYLRTKDRDELLLEAVNFIHAAGGEVRIRSLFGEEKKVRAEIREVSLVKNRLIIEKS